MIWVVVEKKDSGCLGSLYQAKDGDLLYEIRCRREESQEMIRVGPLPWERIRHRQQKSIYYVSFFENGIQHEVGICRSLVLAKDLAEKHRDSNEKESD